MRMCEYNIAVEQDAVEEKTPGGLYKPPSVQEIDKHMAVKGRVVAMSPYAFDQWLDARPALGDKVLFAKHAGMFYRADDGRELRLMKDKDVLAVLA